MKCIKIILLLLPISCFGQHEELIEKATYPKIAKAIYRHESISGKSVLAKKHNNVYGFKGGKRKVGKTKGEYSIYENKSDSVLDYLDFERKLIEKHNLDTKEKYLQYLGKIYAFDKNWLKAIKKLI